MNENKNFMDSKTIFAIVLVAVIWLGWQMHLTKKYGPSNKGAAQETAAAQTESTQQAAPTTIETQQTVTAGNVATQKQAEIRQDQEVVFEDDVWRFEVYGRGMGVRNILLKKYNDRSGDPVILANELSEGIFNTTLLGRDEPLHFNLRKEGNVIIGEATFGAMKVEKSFEIDSQKYAINTFVKVTGTEAGVRGLAFNIVDRIKKPISTTFLMPSYDFHSVYVAHNNTEYSTNLKEDGTGKIGETYDSVSLASIGSLYFAKVLFDKSDIRPQFSAEYLKIADTVLAKGTFSYLFPAGLNAATLNMTAFAGPKELSLMKSIDKKFEGVIGYGMLGVLAKPMLKLLKWLNSVFKNWGIAIIFLTLIVRSLVLPLYMASFKSTKAMQKVQPQIQSLKEKYKDNSQQLNAEMMKLFKEHKVNPLGGCLPMLLQLPIFFALYRVLSNSIELYQSPFMFWIHDLSVKDPYYVLPVLMGVSMFFQQKITPMTTADPAQQKVLMFMPILFSFMMLSLPSGLTLYIFVSTLFGIAQQFVFMRDKSSKKNLVTAKAKA